MFLRVLMIGFVSCLGVDPAMWNDLGRSAHVRCTWCNARHHEETAWAAGVDRDQAASEMVVSSSDSMPTGLDAFAFEAVAEIAPVMVAQDTVPAPTPPAVEAPAPVPPPPPAIAEAPAPVVAEAPAPTVVEVPAPVVAEAPAPAIVEAPAPVVAEAPAIVEAPAPVVAEAPAIIEAPAPVVAEAPALAPAPVVVEVPAAPVVEEPVPYVIAQDVAPAVAPTPALEPARTEAPVIAEAPAPAPAAEAVAAVEPPSVTIDSDVTFTTMVDQMVLNFGPELSAPAASTQPAPVLAATEAALPASAEEVHPEASLTDELAMDRWVEGLFGSEDVSTAIVESTPTQPEAQSEPAGDRIVNAMNLTTQAFQAWLSVLQAPSVALEGSPDKASR